MAALLARPAMSAHTNFKVDIAIFENIVPFLDQCKDQLIATFNVRFTSLSMDATSAGRSASEWLHEISILILWSPARRRWRVIDSSDGRQH